jgi:hypothetical protein
MDRIETILGIVLLVLMTVAGIRFARRRLSLSQAVMEVLGILVGAGMGAIPGVFFLFAGLMQNLAGSVPVFTWPTVVGIGAVVAGASLGLWYRAGATGGWAPPVAALAGGAIGVGASVAAFLLIENSWVMCWVALAPVSIASTAVGGHALAGGT